MSDATLSRVSAIVATACGEGSTIEPDTPFLAAGMVDSFALIQMIAALEAEFDVAIAPEALTQENFATVEAIVALLERCRA